MAYRRVKRSPSRMRVHDNSKLISSLTLSMNPDDIMQSFSHKIFRDEQKDLANSLQESCTSIEKGRHISRLHSALTSEREKSSRLQSRCNQQGMELKRKEQHINRLREKLSQFTDRHKPRGLSMEIMNVLPKRTGQRDPAFKTPRGDGRTEEALRLLLERREAELREAMKLRHSLTTLLHMLRKDMSQTLQDNSVMEVELETENNVLVQSEQFLGDHVTGGVIQEWTHVQTRLRELMSQSNVAQGTDQEKLLAHLEAELEESRQLVRRQQQLLQDSVTSPLPAALMDCYYLEEWEQLQDRWEEFKRQRWSFQREREAFTEAAIRLGRERCEFEQQKASLLKNNFLRVSPVKENLQWNRRESTALSDLRAAGPDQLSLSPCAPATPLSEGSKVMPWSRQSMVMTPNTPELYSALKLPYRVLIDTSNTSCHLEPQRAPPQKGVSKDDFAWCLHMPRNGPAGQKDSFSLTAGGREQRM